MISYDDSKKAVESLFGEIQGYKAISFTWDSFLDNGNFRTGNNYVFVGRVFSSANLGNNNDIVISLWNGKLLSFNNDNGGNDNHTAWVEVIAKDMNGRPAVDLSACQQPEAVCVTGWLFQINK